MDKKYLNLLLMSKRIKIKKIYQIKYENNTILPTFVYIKNQHDDITYHFRKNNPDAPKEYNNILHFIPLYLEFDQKNIKK
jgi:hypothetical protein